MEIYFFPAIMDSQRRQSLMTDTSSGHAQPEGPDREHTSSDENEDFYSAKSHISDDVGGDSPETVARLSHVLSDAENRRLDDKIDKLMAVLEAGRQVHFAQDPLTGDFEVSARYGDQVPEVESLDLEANIAASPENFGQIVSSRRQMKRSLNSVVFDLSSTDSLPPTPYDSSEELSAFNGGLDEHQHVPMMGLGTVITDKHDLQHRNPIREHRDIQQAVRKLEKKAGEPRGHRLAIIGTSGLETHQINPIPLDFKKILRTTTPSAHGGGTEPDRSSLLFTKSYIKRPQSASSWTTLSSSDSEKASKSIERVVSWLRRVETPSKRKALRQDKSQSRRFGVFNDFHKDHVAPGITGKRTQAPRILKDVSNIRRTGYSPDRSGSKIVEDMAVGAKAVVELPALRQPGYLQHNSFATANPSRTIAKRSAALALPTHRFGGALDKESRRSFINERWPGLLRNASKAADEAIRSAIDGAIEVVLEPAETHFPAEEIAAAEGLLHPNAERAAHFELALTRLEGRAPPDGGSPIRRYVHNEGLYGEDVEVDLRQVRFRQPKPIRNTNGRAARRFLQTYG